MRTAGPHECAFLGGARGADHPCAGEPSDIENCGSCDNCLEPRETWDGTIAAQKLLSTVYRARDFQDAKRITKAILDYQGRGHSCGIHTRDMAHAREIAEEIDVVRVLVNEARPVIQDICKTLTLL